MFNTTEVKEYFINPCCFGDDVARWLVGRPREAGVEVDDDIGQEDFGWYLNFDMPEGEHCVVLGFRPGDDDTPGHWVAEVERDVGFFRSILGGRRKGIAPSAVRAVHEALEAPEICNIRWHERANFDAGNEELGTPQP
ncbi:MAG: hypothetical protein H6751_15345 [Candidatus Omnitrophica bacterium]|nr:hypothetical protein [Candidatus Omnitrophota bacterium]